MKVGLDTSVVLRLLIGEPEAQAKQAVSFLNRSLERGDQPVVSDLVVSEVYFALQHHYRVPKAEVLHVLRDFFGSGDVENVGVAAKVLETNGLDHAKPGFLDRVIYTQYLQHAHAMVTFEKAAQKLGNVHLIQP